MLSFQKKQETLLLFISVFFLFFVLFLQDITSNYKHFAPHTSVDDLAFSYIPMMDFSLLYFGETWILLGIAFFAIRASKISVSFIVFSFALLFLVRSLVLLPTGIGTPMNQIIPHGFGFGVVYYLQNDMFFSGHTACPALFTFLFWNIRWARYVFMISTGIIAYAVLSMRIHYSIDVIGAIFASHFVYHISLALYSYVELFLKKYIENPKNNDPKNNEESGPV